MMTIDQRNDVRVSPAEVTEGRRMETSDPMIRPSGETKDSRPDSPNPSRCSVDYYDPEGWYVPCDCQECEPLSNNSMDETVLFDTVFLIRKLRLRNRVSAAVIGGIGSEPSSSSPSSSSLSQSSSSAVIGARTRLFRSRMMVVTVLYRVVARGHLDR